MAGGQREGGEDMDIWVTLALLLTIRMAETPTYIERLNLEDTHPAT